MKIERITSTNKKAENRCKPLKREATAGVEERRSRQHLTGEGYGDTEKRKGRRRRREEEEDGARERERKGELKA